MCGACPACLGSGHWHQLEFSEAPTPKRELQNLNKQHHSHPKLWTRISTSKKELRNDEWHKRNDPRASCSDFSHGLPVSAASAQTLFHGLAERYFPLLFSGFSHSNMRPPLRQLPAGSRASSTVSSNPFGSKHWDGRPQKCSISTHQIIMGGTTWIRWIRRNILKLMFRDQAEPRKYFPSLVVRILWGSFLHCEVCWRNVKSALLLPGFWKASLIGHCFL